MIYLGKSGRADRVHIDSCYGGGEQVLEGKAYACPFVGGYDDDVCVHPRCGPQGRQLGGEAMLVIDQAPSWCPLRGRVMMIGGPPNNKET